MDRKQAQAIIGKLVSIDEGQDGSYIGILNDVIAPPHKTWRGIVTIKAVANLPTFQGDDSNLQLPQLKYKDNEVIECIGSKLSISETEIPLNQSFEESLISASNQRFLQLTKQYNKTSLQKEALNLYLLEKGLDSGLVDESLDPTSNENDDNSETTISYTFFKKDERYILIDERNEKLDLEDCPFEFRWDNEQPFIGYYEEDGTFISKEGIRFSPRDGTIFKIEQKQFEPYFIFQNELEPEALQSLETYLQTIGLTHEHNIECHNTLLRQFLNADGEKTFKGVNFLTYLGKQGIVLVQHHFERKLHDHINDEIYDRFEFTTENGKRSIVTFTNEFTK